MAPSPAQTTPSATSPLSKGSLRAVGIEDLHQGQPFLEHRPDLLEVLVGHFVDRNAQALKAPAHDLARIVEDDDVLAELFLKYVIVGLDIILDELGIHDDPDCPSHVRNRIFVAGIERHARELRRNVLHVWDCLAIDWGEHVFLDEPFDHVLAGLDEIVGATTREKLRKHLLI